MEKVRQPTLHTDTYDAINPDGFRDSLKDKVVIITGKYEKRSNVQTCTETKLTFHQERREDWAQGSPLHLEVQEQSWRL